MYGVQQYILFRDLCESQRYQGSKKGSLKKTRDKATMIMKEQSRIEYHPSASYFILIRDSHIGEAASQEKARRMRLLLELYE